MSRTPSAGAKRAPERHNHETLRDIDGAVRLIALLCDMQVRISPRIISFCYLYDPVLCGP